MNKLLIIDGLNLVRRIHAVLPDENDIASVKERTISASKKLLNHHKPTHAIVVWDGDEESWRKRLYPDYKKGRKPMPAALKSGLADIKVALAEANIHSHDAASEADDVIATLATKIAENNGKAIIVSTDKGFGQISQSNIDIWDHFKQQYFEIKEYEKKLAVQQNQILDFIALAGDSGNKVPGIAGIGPKSAADLLNKFRSLANLYKSIDNLGAKQAQKLLDGKDMARVSYKLAQLQCHMPLNINLKQFRVPAQNERNA
ncbi:MULTISPECIES: flap endonuclease Xni [unclassified Shewanella]|uniref:flap endonuclease Xni n=1 Tax=unclassified Shewanella TaxID=196818 RepID=UPI000C8588D4|nr:MULTISPECIES: flap endonuclease Xni [unclassified Shewanella]MCC4832594.1 flap endonuclease Xni [Shewanella sp. 10N.7]PMG75063.1 flap endonuclease Xni [Shewanella sp. 10N.286.51.B7]